MRGAAIAGLLALAVALAVPSLLAVERLAVSLIPHCSLTSPYRSGVATGPGTPYTRGSLGAADGPIVVIAGQGAAKSPANGGGYNCSAVREDGQALAPNATLDLPTTDSIATPALDTWVGDADLPFAGVPAAGLARTALPPLHALLLLLGVAALILRQIGAPRGYDDYDDEDYE